MNFDEFLAVTFILSAVLILAGYGIMRQTKPPTMVQDIPKETPTEHKRRVLASKEAAQDELRTRLKRVK